MLSPAAVASVPTLTWPPRLQFVQCLGNPRYLTHLAAQKHLSDPAFVAYLSYLRYWSRPPYVKYLTYPGPTLKALQLLQSERFRRDIIHPTLADQLMAEGMRAAVEWHVEKPPPALRGQQQQQGQQQVGSTAGPAAGPGGS